MAGWLGFLWLCSVVRNCPTQPLPFWKNDNILFPTDFSELSDAARPLATVLARDNQATLHIVHIKGPAKKLTAAGAYGDAPVDASTPALTQMLNSVKPTDETVPCRHHLIMGDPADDVVRFAEREGMDLIVMGTHGRTGLSRMLMGSVAEAVVRHATCPVLTVKVPEKVFPQPDTKGAET